MDKLIFCISAASFYLLAAALIADMAFRRENAIFHSRNWPLLAAWIGLAIQVWGFTHWNISDSGLNLSLPSVVSFSAGSIVFLLLLSALSKPIESLGMIVFSVASATMIMCGLSEHTFTTETTDSGLKAHILLSIVSYSLVGLAAAQALLLWVQNKSLKQHHPGGFIRTLPPLQTMEDFLFELIIGGFILLSAALITGFIYLHDIFAQHLVHKTILSIISWLILSVLLWGRFAHGWRGKKAIRWTLGAFTFLLLSYFGSKFVIEMILQR